jgi:hypothetical protein
MSRAGDVFGPTPSGKRCLIADPEAIYNWRRLDSRITTSGQPTEKQLADTHALGVRHIVYLAGRAFLYDSVAQSWEAAQAGRALSVREVAVLRLARTHAVHAAVQAVDLMFPVAGVPRSTRATRSNAASETSTP